MFMLSIESFLHRYGLAVVTAIVLLLPSGRSVTAGEYVRVSPDLEIYYEEIGSGTPLIFNPGWTGTTEFFHSSCLISPTVIASSATIRGVMGGHPRHWKTTLTRNMAPICGPSWRRWNSTM
jgi:hypothetical protein